jgi:phenylalanine-4-hydroxylase
VKHENPLNRLDWTVEQKWSQYSPAEHHLWRSLYERQIKLLPGRVCEEFRQGLDKLPLASDQIPDFDLLSATLRKQTGWEVVPVAGLVPDEVFFEHLANRRFPAGRFIRKASQMDYLEEPDVFHDLFGHVPMLMHPVIADFVQAYGQGGLRAQSLGFLPMLARVYWYTIEFGLVKQDQGIKIYGAGIASSYAEADYALTSAKPNRLGFQLERIMRTEYRIDDFQETYFVLERIEDLLHLAEVDFEPLYRSLAAMPSFAAGSVLDSDRKC